MIVASVSMVLTPLLALAAGRIGRHLQNHRDVDEAEVDIGEISDHVIIAGFGRVGSAVAQLLASRSIAYVAVDRDLRQVRRGRKRDIPVVYGNATEIADLSYYRDQILDLTRASDGTRIALLASAIAAAGLVLAAWVALRRRRPA